MSDGAANLQTMTTEDEAGSLSPEHASMAAAALNLATRDLVAVQGGILTNVHRAGQCVGEHCWIHNPSEHHMVAWPMSWRADKRTAERVCPHGIGHPDPDDVAFNARIGRGVTIHGCDGCCTDPR